MVEVDWRLKGEWLKNCNCAFGCPCDFNALPTYGHCSGILAMNIREGHFGDVRLDGVKFAAAAHWPGPLHEGNGTMQPFIDERASPQQREAILAILSGQHSAEGTLFDILSKVIAEVLEPQFAPIEFAFDKTARRATVRIPDLLETEVEPIRNPVTGAEHRIQVMMPDGFEHREAEVASARISSTGGVKFAVPQGHSSLATVEHGPAGVAA